MSKKTMYCDYKISSIQEVNGTTKVLINFFQGSYQDVTDDRGRIHKNTYVRSGKIKSKEYIYPGSVSRDQIIKDCDTELSQLAAQNNYQSIAVQTQDESV